MYYLAQRGVPIMSKRLVCDELSVDDRKLNRVLPRLASAWLRLQEEGRRQAETIVATPLPAEAKIHIVDFAAYDETPLAVQVRNEQRSMLMASSAQADASSGVAEPEPRLVDFMTMPSLKVRTNAQAQKVLQMSQAGGMLLRINEQFVILLTLTSNGLALMESGTAESLAACQLRLSSATRAAATFQQQTRAACIDGGSANMPCEKIVSHLRGPRCASLHTHTHTAMCTAPAWCMARL